MYYKQKEALAGNMITAGKPPAAASGFDVFNVACPARAVLDHLGDKWALLIIERLGAGPVRFNQIRRDISGISQKVLSQVLRRLERDGLVARTAYPTVPVTVEYALTDLGRTLRCRVDPLLRWAEANMGKIRAAQQQFDQNLEQASD
jgi:DNA-binding HxlR family transcriptional regulator